MALWQSPLDPAHIFSRAATVSHPQALANSTGEARVVIQPQVAEKGRLAAVLQQNNKTDQVLTPAKMSVRSGVNEYGGKCHCVAGEALYFNDASSGELYKQALQGATQPSVQPVTVSSHSQYADLSANEAAALLVAVCEKHVAGQESRHSLVGIALNDASKPRAPIVLVEGADFYANPCISPCGKRLAWFEWSHPHMPWDQSRLMCAEIEVNTENVNGGTGWTLVNMQAVVDQPEISVCQLGWLQDGSLVFAMDGAHPAVDKPVSGYWNLYRWRNNTLCALTQDTADYGEAHWIYGQTRWVQQSAESLIAIRTEKGSDALVRITLKSSPQPVEIVQEAAIFSQMSSSYPLASGGVGEVLGMVHQADQEPSVFSLSASGCFQTSGALALILDAKNLSLAQPIEYACSLPEPPSEETAYGYYYPPKNSEHTYSEKAAPPLLVMVHGGPTSRTTAELALLKQYFTSSGFAILDVNHRGSTGYGRAYRQRLLGGWGMLDAADIEAGVRYLVAHKLANPQQIFIRGGSAGGYAVLRALTRYAALFAGGACYYGIGNLITLSEITHKFESRYTDRLIGEPFDAKRARSPESEYVKRSPIFEIEQLKSPVILFQGLEDKVVPPAVSREVVETLKRNGVAHEYVEYAGEGHGFRQAETRIDSLKREMAFYSGIIEAVQ